MPSNYLFRFIMSYSISTIFSNFNKSRDITLWLHVVATTLINHHRKQGAPIVVIANPTIFRSLKTLFKLVPIFIYKVRKPPWKTLLTK